MTPEERLRQLLHEDDDVPVAGDGLHRIRQRLDARRSLRTRLLVPAASLAGVVAVAAVGALGVAATDNGSIRPDVATGETAEPVEPSPSGTACSGGLCPEPKPSPSLPTTGVTTSGNGVPVWPFTTDAQAADWLADPGARGWARDPVQVVQHLVDDFLKLPGGTAVGTAGGGDVQRVVVKIGGRPVSTVQVEQVGRTTSGPWSVTGAASEDVGITAPEADAAVTSPLTVTGRVTGVDESVRVQLLASSGTELAGGYAPAGAEEPWSLPLRWTSSAWSVGAVVASTANGNGDLRAFGLTPVRRGGAAAPGVPAAGSTLLAIDAGRVVVVDAVTGVRLRQLSYPPPDFADSDPARGGDDGVVWVRTSGNGCTSSIIRAGLARGPAGITVDAEDRARRLPSLSEGGRSLAWVERPCQEGTAETVVVRGPDARLSTIVQAPEPVAGIDVRDDGTVLLGLANAVFVVPEGTSSLAGATQLVARPGCTVRAPAWDGDVPTAWERCDDGQRLTRYDEKGAAVSASGPIRSESDVLRSYVAGGSVLVVLADGPPFRFSEGRLNAIPRGKELAQAAW